MSLAKETQELARLQNEFEGYFSRTFGGFPSLGSSWAPSVDMQELNGNVVVKADLPGVSRENVEIIATETSLSIQGHTSESTEEKQDHFHRQERRHGQFLRVLALPASIDVNKTEAKFENGTVTITLPKVSKTLPQGKKIEIA